MVSVEKIKKTSESLDCRMRFCDIRRDTEGSERCIYVAPIIGSPQFILILVSTQMNSGNKKWTRITRHRFLQRFSKIWIILLSIYFFSSRFFPRKNELQNTISVSNHVLKKSLSKHGHWHSIYCCQSQSQKIHSLLCVQSGLVSSRAKLIGSTLIEERP